MGVWYVLKNGRWVSLAPRFPRWLIKWPRRVAFALSLWRETGLKTAWQVACGIWD